MSDHGMSELREEYAPSSAQDGQPENCGACQHSYPVLMHTCHLRPMSAAEREFIEATFYGLGYGSDRWMAALNALRAERRAEREVKRG